MKVLIINLHSSHNAGDDVLTRVTVSQLQKAFVTPELILAMNDPASYDGFGKTVGSFMTWFKVDRKGHASWKLFAAPWLLFSSMLTAVLYRLFGVHILGWVKPSRQHLLRAYLEADLVVSSAGNFLYSSGRGISLLVTLFTIKFAMWMGKPVYMMPQTVGPLTHRWERIITAAVLRDMRLCFVRDAISKLELMKMKAWSDRCFLVPDMAFIFPKMSARAGQRILATADIDIERNRPLLGITLINWAAQNKAFNLQEQYETAVAAAIRHFVQAYNGRVVLFAQVRGPTWAEDDLVPAQSVKETVRELGGKVVLVEESVSAEQLKAAYGQMDLFIGTRLHSNIFALSESVPAIMIQYQYKTLGVARMLDLEEWVINIETVRPSTLIKKLDQLVEQKEALHQKIAHNLVEIKQQVTQVCRQIAVDFEKSV